MKLTKQQTKNKECVNALMGAYSGLHKLIELRNSILKGHLEMSGYVDTTDKKLHDSVSEIIDTQHELITRLEKVI